MKRVSKDNVEEMAKRMAKTSYSSPGIVFKVAFEQLESYPNLIDAFVGCAEYFTEMSYDVLVWSLMNSLGKSRSRTQSDHALTTSKWLQALSRFSGKVFRKYLALDPTPVLQYVNDQLYRGNSTDLIILKEFISSMGGIVDALDFTDQQILSMTGGERLRRATLIAAQDRRFDNIEPSKRLTQALVESKLAARLLINLAQYRQAAIFQVPEDEAHIKFLSTIVDDSQQALIRYLDFLWSNLSPAAFDELVPSISQLMSSFGLDPSLAFLIGRSSLSHRMFPWSSKKGAINETPAQQPKPADNDGDVDMDDSKGADDTNATPEAPVIDSQVRATSINQNSRLTKFPEIR
jgi:THO complex subunit 2